MRYTTRWLKFAFLSAVAMASAVVVVAASNTARIQARQAPVVTDTTVTGCLIQGSSTTVFLLDNARMDPKDSTEKGKRYFFVSKLEDVPLKDLLNHELTVTGTVTTRTDVRPMTPPPTEKDLPVLTARSVATIADRCMNNARR